MSCGFCHVGPSPISPPADPENPGWANLSSIVGAQYMWVDRLFIYDCEQAGGPHELHVPARPHLPAGRDGHLAGLDRQHQQPAHDERGLQRSGARSSMARRSARKRWPAASSTTSSSTTSHQRPADASSSPSPRHGLHAARAEGRRGFGRRCSARSTASTSTSACSARSGCCISTRSSAARTITPIEIADAQRNSSYWQATEAGTPDMARFFLKAAQPDRLNDAPGGDEYLTADAAALERGKRSSPKPARAAIRARRRTPPPRRRARRLRGRRLPRLLGALLDAGPRRTSSRRQMRDIVARARLPRRQLSLDRPARAGDAAADQRLQPARHQRARAATSGTTSRRSPTRTCRRSARSRVHDPFTGEAMPYPMPAGGRGYTRLPSLVSLWSTAPFLLNNTRRPVRHQPVGRGADEGVRRLDRADAVAGEARARPGARRQGAGHHRPHHRAQRRHHPGRLRAGSAAAAAGHAARWLPWLFGEGGDIVLGPIPKGVPVEPARQPQAARRKRRPRRQAAHVGKLGDLLLELKRDLATLPANATDERAARSASPTCAGRCSRSASARTSSSTAATTSAPPSSTAGRPERDEKAPARSPG